MTFRAAGVKPPIRFRLAPSWMLTPGPVFRTTPVPAASVPMKFPETTLLSVPGSVIRPRPCSR